MALAVANRVQETGTANTTVSFTLAGAVAGYQTFSAGVGVNTTYYAATDASGRWEVGIGAVNSPTLTRTTILASSNSGSAVSTFSGTLNIFVTYPSAAGILETKSTIAASNLDLSTGNYFSKTISATTTFTVSNVPASGTAFSLILDLTNGGGYPITWWSGVVWAGGSAPVLTNVGRDTLGFFTYDGGSTWTGLVLGKNVSLTTPWTVGTQSNNGPTIWFGVQGIMVNGVMYMGGGSGALVGNSSLGYNRITYTAPSGLSTVPVGINYSNTLGIYVASGFTGAVFSSTDFVTWTAGTSGSTATLNYVAVGGSSGSTFVIPTSDGATLYSTNGTTWSTGTAAGVLASQLYSCVWANNQFLAVGYNSTGTVGVILTSALGTTSWTSRTSGTANVLRGVCWTGTRYVAVGDAGTVLNSTDGITWTAATSGTTTPLLNVAVASNGTTVVAVGGDTSQLGHVIRSTDGGVTWSAAINVGVGLNNYKGLIWTGDRFFMCSVASVGDAFWSYDGVTWYYGFSGRGAPAYNIGYNSSADTYLVPGYGEVGISTAGGALWQGRTPSGGGANAQSQGAAYASSLSSWFLASNAGNVRKSADNGLTWTAVASNIGSVQLNGAVWSGSLAVVTASGNVSTSPDLTTWTAYAFTDAGFSVVYANSLFVMGSQATVGRVSSSSTGLTGSWTTVNTGTGQLVYGVCWTGSLWVAVGAAGTIATSPDLVTWTLRTSGTTNLISAVAAQSSSVVYASSLASILKSVDGGITWTQEVLPAGLGSINYRAIYATASKVVASGLSGSVNYTVLTRS
jgi:hypothetical protein